MSPSEILVVEKQKTITWYLDHIMICVVLILVFFLKPYHAQDCFRLSKLFGVEIELINGQLLHFLLGCFTLYIYQKIKYHFFDFLFLGFTMFVLLSSFWAYNTANSIAISAIYIGIFCSYINFRYFYYTYGYKGLVFVAKVVSILTLYLILHYFYFNFELYRELINSNYPLHNLLKNSKSLVGSKNWMSMFLVLTLPFPLLLASNTTKRNWFYKIVLALAAVIIFCSGSRNGIIGLLIFLTFYLASKKNIFGEIKYYVIFIALALGYTFYVVGVDRVLGKLMHKSFDSRLRIWEQTIEIFLDSNFFFGTGVGQWSIFRNVYGFINDHHVHNDYLATLCEMGLLGFVLFLILLFSLLYYSIIAFRNKNKSDEKRCVIMFLGLIVAYLFMIFFDELRTKYNHQILFMCAWAWIIHEQKNSFIRLNTFWKYIGLLLLALYISYPIFVVQNHFYFRSAIVYKKGGFHETALAELEKIDKNIIDKVEKSIITVEEARAFLTLKEDSEAFAKLQETLLYYPSHKWTNEKLSKWYHYRKEYELAKPYMTQLQKSDFCNPFLIKVLKNSKSKKYGFWRDEMLEIMRLCPDLRNDVKPIIQGTEK